MYMYRMLTFDKGEHLFIKRKGQGRVQAALKEYLYAFQRKGFLYFSGQFFPGQDIASLCPIFSKEGTEPASRNAYIRIIDVAVNDVGNQLFGVKKAAFQIGQFSKGKEIRMVVKRQGLFF